MDDASLIGQLVSDRYRVLSVLGNGGMGRVYLAEHVAIQKRVALKVLHPQYSKRREIVERFQQEAISASRIKHPGVLEVFDFGELNDGSSYIAMELLEGRDLGATLEQFGPLRPELSIDVLVQVCRALDAAHASGVVHRDLKPDNVFLQPGEAGRPTVKIVDFGIARLRGSEETRAASEHPREASAEEAPRRRLTKTGMIFGTPEYMAPEQAQGREADQRSDVYAAGVILFECLTGAVPYTGESFLEVLNRHVVFEIPRLEDVSPDLVVSEELEGVLRRALAKDPEARFASMRELATALLAVPEGSALNLGHDSATWRLRRTPASSPIHSTPTLAPSEAPSSSQGVTQMRGTPLTVAVDVPMKRSLGPWIAVGLAAVAAAVGGAYLSLKLGKADETQSAALSPSVEATVAKLAAAAHVPVPPAPATKVSADVQLERKQIALHISTTPSGAVVHKNGFQVCDRTPCDVLASPDESLVLSAELAGQRGEAKVLAQREQNVAIQLKPKPSAQGTKPSKSTASGATSSPQAESSGPKMCEVTVDGLKILRPCP